MSRRERLIVVALILLPIARVIATYHVFSETADEPIHLAAGFEWWRSGTYDFEAEHPPLARICFALQPFLTGATMKPGNLDRAAAGNEILYRNDRYSHNLERVRAGNLPFVLIALLSVWFLARQTFDPSVAIVALALFGAMPPVLGHAGVATTDMAVTALVAAASCALVLWLAEPDWRNAMLLAIAIGFGLITKFSFPLFFVIAAAAMLVAKHRTMPRQWKRRSVQLLVVFAVSALFVIAAYRFATGTINDAVAEVFPPRTGEAVAARYARVPGYWWVRGDVIDRFWAYSRAAAERGFHDVDFVDWAKAAGYPSPLAGRHGNTMAGAPPVESRRQNEIVRSAVQWFATHVRVPAPQFFAGAELVAWHSRVGHPAFLLGRYSHDGWWYYFPVVFFFKTPIAFLVLALIGSAIAMRMGGAAAAIAIAPLVMFVPAMFSALNIGVRHVLPVYPFFCVVAAAGAVATWRRSRTAAVVLLAWFFIATALAHPDYLAYFNEFAGGHPERIAADSNLDWGQDLLRLGSVVSKRHIDHLYVSYFGSAEWKRHLPHGEELPTGVPVDGWIAISEMHMQIGDDFRWLQNYKPVARAGKSIRLYNITLR